MSESRRLEQGRFLRLLLPFLPTPCKAVVDVCAIDRSVVCVEGAAAGKSAYVRYVVPTPDDEEATVEYDLDEEDEEWLQLHNHKVPDCCIFSRPVLFQKFSLTLSQTHVVVFSESVFSCRTSIVSI